MLKVIYILFIISFAVIVQSQNSSVEYNQERNGFGSVTIEPETIELDTILPEFEDQNPVISNISNLTFPSRQQPTVNNITFYTVIRDGSTNDTTGTDEIQTSTINSRQSDYGQINYQQNPQQQQYYQPQQQQQQITPYNNQQQFQQQPFQQQQQQPNQGCTLAGCTPPHVDQRQYEANAQQYSYSNINFNNQQQQQSPINNNNQQQQFNGQPQPIYGNPQTINSNQNSPGGIYPGTYQGQPLMDSQQSQQPYNPQGNNNFGGGVISPNQQFQGQQEPGNLQQVSILNYSNNSGFEPPVAERLTITQLPNGTFINVERTQTPTTSQGGSNNFGGSPGYLPPQQQPLYNNNNQFQNPNTIGSGGTIYGQGNPSLNNQQQQQQYPPGFNPQDQTLYDQSQSYPYMGVNRLNGNGLISTGGVIMEPNSDSGVPLLVNPDYLYNNFRTGQIKVIDASYNPNQFVDYQTFQQRQYYGNFVSLRTQFVNYDYNALHILNAVYFNIDIATYPTRNQRYTLYPPALFQQYVRMLGINQNDYIIVYSRDTLGGMRYASAVWELFRIYNHTRISVLNGGLNAWSVAGYDTTTNIVNPQTGNWIAGFDPLKVITFEEMVAIQPNGRCYFQETAMFNFLDTRTRIEFQQNGRLSGSKNFPINEIIQQNGMIMSRDDINIALARSNYTRGQTSFVFGTNGPESSFGVLALAVVGETTARLYNGGIYEINQRSPYILVR